MGRSLFGTDEKSIFWFNWDPSGITTSLTAVAVLSFSIYAMITQIIDKMYYGYPSYKYHMIFVLFSSINAFISHMRCMFTDPGAVPSNAVPVDQNEAGDLIRKCTRCQTFKPPRAHHCSVCKRCIIKMDHHCPWTNNCIGFFNIKYFTLYVFYIFILSVYAFPMVIIYFKNTEGVGIQLTYWNKFSVCLMFIFSLLFGFFTFSLLVDMIYVITSSNTNIDNMQNHSFTSNTRKQSIAEVFGGNGSFSIFWFLPTAPRYKNLEDTLGYRRMDSNELSMVDEMNENDENRSLLYHKH